MGKKLGDNKIEKKFDHYKNLVFFGDVNIGNTLISNTIKRKL